MILNLRPPVPTSDQLPKDEARKQRRAAMAPVIIGLVIVLGLTAFSALSRSTPIISATFHTGEMNSDEANGQPYEDSNVSPDTNANFMPPANVGQLLLIRPDDTTLTQEPADLPQPPQGRRVAAFERNEGQIREQFAFWKINNTTIANIMSFYENAAVELNFQRTSSAVNKTTTASKPATTTGMTTETKSAASDQTTDTPVTMMFNRGRKPDTESQENHTPDNGVLIIRAKPTNDGQVLVTLWYRHAVYTPRK